MSENLIGATTAVFPIRLSVAVESPVDVEWATRDGSAVAGSDYKAAAGTVTFLPGETEKQIEVQVYGQAITPADDKVFFIRLNPPSNAVLVDAILTCTINIIDDQGVPSVAVVVAEGRRGPKGDTGLSAYEQAVLMGYTGTLAEWMDQIADASKAADRAGDHAISASEDALKAQNAAKNAVFAGVIFPTTAEGVDPILGVKNGAYFNVRSPLSEHYIDEYRNVNGVAVATGKSYPTSDHFQNISEHTALPFVDGTSYKINRRVVLTNGDIVKSTLGGNTNDPNEDMTGWVETNSASQVFALNPLNRMMRRALEEKLNGEFASVKDGGAIGDGTLHTLQEWVDSGKFSSLTAIKLVYPTAEALTDSIDTVVIQTWIDTYPRPFIPEGAYIITKTLDFEGSGKEIYGESVSTYGDGSHVGTRFIHAFNGPLISFNTKTTTNPRGRHRVRGIALVSDNTYAGTAIAVQSSQNHIIDMSFYQFKDGGIRIKGRSYGTYIKTPSFDRCGSNGVHDITVDIDTGGASANDYNTLTVITDLISETPRTGAISIVNSDPFYITRSYIEPYGSVSTKPMIDIKNSASGNTKGWVYDNYIGSINGNGLAISAVGTNLFVNHNMLADFNNGIYFATQTGTCKGNIVRGYSGNGIQVASTAANVNNNAEVSGNILLSKTSGAVHGIILSSGVNGGTLTSNIVRGKHQYGARLLSAHNFIISSNIILPDANNATLISNEGIYEDDICTGNTVKANSVVAGTRAYRRYSWDYDRHVLSSNNTPTVGVWKKGQIVEVPDPIAFGATGYICTTAGTGTAAVWQKYGLIIKQIPARQNVVASDLAALVAAHNALLADLRAANIMAT